MVIHIDKIVHEAWEEARDEVRALCDASMADANSPAAAAAADPNAAKHAILTETYATFAIGFIMRSEFAIAMGIRAGVFNQAQVGSMITYMRNFAQQVAFEARYLCTAAPCDWAGTLEDAGPSGYCPKCQQQKLKPAPKLATPKIVTGP